MTCSRTIHSAAISSIVLAAMVLAAGCGKESPVASAPVQKTQPAPQATPPAAVPAAPPAAQPAPAPSVAAAPAATPAQAPPAAAVPSLGVQDHEVSGIQVALLEVKRTSGDTLTVKWQYRSSAKDEIQVSELWSHRAADGAYLIDAVNKKKYLVVRDAGSVALSSDGRSDRIAPGAAVTSWAKFPAPPADVAKITVNVKGVPPFEDVPIAQ